MFLIRATGCHNSLKVDILYFFFVRFSFLASFKIKKALGCGSVFSARLLESLLLKANFFKQMVSSSIDFFTLLAETSKIRYILLFC